jgi:hypothetical protein
MDSYGVFIRNRFSVLRVSLILASFIIGSGCKEKQASPQLETMPSKSDSKWMQCQSDTNCAASFGPCGEWVAVNREFVKQQQAWAIKEGRVLSCPENKSPIPTVLCRDQVCATQP